MTGDKTAIIIAQTVTAFPQYICPIASSPTTPLAKYAEYIKVTTITFLFFLLCLHHSITVSQKRIIVGADQVEKYLPLLKDKKVGIVAHQASIVNSKTHLVDSLVSLKINKEDRNECKNQFIITCT